MLYFNIGAQASQKKALASLGGARLVGQGYKQLATVPAPLNQATEMHYHRCQHQ